MPVEGIRELDRGGSWDAAVDSKRFVLSDCTLVVEDVEPIKLNPQLTNLPELNRVVGAEIQIVSCGRAISPSKRINSRAAGNVQTFVVAVQRMRDQEIDGRLLFPASAVSRATGSGRIGSCFRVSKIGFVFRLMSRRRLLIARIISLPHRLIFLVLSLVIFLWSIFVRHLCILR